MMNLADMIDRYERMADQEEDPGQLAYYIGCAEGIRVATREYEKRIREYSKLTQDLIDNTL